MTEVRITPDHTGSELSAAGPSKENDISFQIFTNIPAHHPKLSKRLPSIVVEQSDGEVESGELRWPPDDLQSLDTTDGTNTEIHRYTKQDLAKQTQINLESKQTGDSQKHLD